MIARTIAACLASAMCLIVARATVTNVTRVPAFGVDVALNIITMDPAAYTTTLAGCCLQWTTNGTAFQNFSSYAAVPVSDNTHCSNETEPYELPITSSRFSAGVYDFHYDCWDSNSTMSSAGDQLNVRITFQQSSPNATSSTGSAGVNTTSSSGVSGNTEQSSGNATSSTGSAGVNTTSSSGVSGNTDQSSGNATSSTGVSGNHTSPDSSSTGAVPPNNVTTSSTGRESGNGTIDISSSEPAGLSSSSGVGEWVSSSSGSEVIVSSSASVIVSSSSGAPVNNPSSSAGSGNNGTSSSGVRASSSTGAGGVNATSSTGKSGGSVSSSSVPAPAGNPPNTLAARFEIEINGTTVPENLKTLIRNDLCNVIAQQFNTTFDVVEPFCVVEVGSPVPAARRLLAARVPITFTLLGNISSVVDTSVGGGGNGATPMAALNFIKEAIQTGTPILTSASSNLGIVVPVQTVVVEDVSAPVESSTGVEDPTSEDSSSSGLSGGAIAGIVVAVIIGVAILSSVGYAAFAGKLCFKGTASVGVAHATTTPVHVKATKDAEVV